MKSALTLFLFSLFLTGVFGDDVESVSVMEGDSVTLNTYTIIKSNEIIEWKFRDVSIARINRGSSKTVVTVQNEGAFKDRLQLDNQTGVLKIMKIRITDSGPFTLEIRSNKITSKTFNLIVSAGPVKSVSVLEGDSVTLHTGVPEPQRYDVVQWRFGHLNSPIAEINRKTRQSFTSNTDEGFRDRLQLDYWTGSLNIRNIRTKHTGDYEFDISTSKHTIHKSFTVTVHDTVKSVSVKEGKSVTLNSSLTEIQPDDLMHWMFKDSQIAEIYKADDRFSTSDGPKGRLKLDHQTGSLTITDTRFTDSGLYELKISSIRRTIYRRITVTVSGLSPVAVAGIVIAVAAVVAVVAAVIYYRRKISKLKKQASELKEWIYKWRILSVIEGESITLNPDEEHKEDKLVWMFRGSCIAEGKISAHNFTVHDDLPDGRFKGRLKLDRQTGSLIIPITRTTDTGVYELLITRMGKSSLKRFSVTVFVKPNEMEDVSVKEGESVTLKTGADIQKVEQIQWKFGLTPLAKIKRGTKKISPSADKIFQDRLKLDHQTGSLIIKNSRPTDAGIYMLYKIEGGNITTILFRIKVESTDNRNNPEEESVRIINPEENVPLRSVP
ncbi:uncharacterized protein LOC143734907 isoform X2 [Siphateles boraxobius]|uniref:uncharacterized protein LOC143734907 isoform X2 n=1 Tax=Siphateles boraxobius TaxID=180520 RepID=UPI0040645888